jgi:exodeoxyribonuclease X
MAMRIRVIDVETTGLSSTEHMICEVGWVDLVGEGQNWKVEGMGEQLCHPGRKIPAEVSAIHHIVDADVIGAPPWPGVLREVCTSEGMFKPDAFCAHNARFEQQWATTDFTRDVPWICTLKVARRLWPDAPSHTNQSLRYMLDAEGLDRDIAFLSHRAMPDAYVTAFTLREMLKVATIEDLVSWTNSPSLLKKIQFGKHRGKRYDEVDSGFLQWLLERDFDEDIKGTARFELKRRQHARAES